ncbi:MAG: hypothetical protein DMD96_02525 [Candidatus Rokuibacteriota bacterium]|nr:MAG: hypothetical protein DMD96_02525 [Candidatus Rokubacteria bacterium]
MALALKRKGITRVRPLLGGLGAWLERQYPVERLQPPSPARTAARNSPTYKEPALANDQRVDRPGADAVDARVIARPSAGM